MQNPFVTLGIPQGANAQEVRAAYHEHVKRCHPDILQDEAAKQAAQAQLVELNLAYAEAMRQANFRNSGAVVITNAKKVARDLYEKGQYDGALRMLNKAPDRDAAWFDLKGLVLLKKGEAEAAHACFRTCVRLDPSNNLYREHALEAAVQMKKPKTVRSKMSGWARNVVSRML